MTKVSPETENCPKCNARWRGEDIYEHFLARRDAGDIYYANKTDEEILECASHYGYTKENPQYFSNLIGIEIRGEYDGVSKWRCPECKQEWNRFTGEEMFHLKIKADEYERKLRDDADRHNQNLKNEIHN